MIAGFDLVKIVPLPCDCTKFNAKPNAEEMKANNLAVGTIISCPRCDAQYEWKQGQRDGYYWERVN